MNKLERSTILKRLLELEPYVKEYNQLQHELFTMVFNQWEDDIKKQNEWIKANGLKEILRAKEQIKKYEEMTNKILLQQGNETENKYICAWKNLSDEEKLMLQEDLEDN